ncbi:PKD domain-containing protein [Polaribacter sp. R77954]|uniref:PKD domain-containing protein n=1 Tax=Polaribacter sp. R77954 TaxID=3093870 RepID=UPI0037CC1A2B
MKKIIKNRSIFSLLIVSLLLITSCEDNEDGITNPGEIGTAVLARFTKVKEGKTVTFINISENATSYKWDLGDGTTSNLINPEKRYFNGTYTVTLTASNDKGETSTTNTTFIIDGCVDETEENIDPANGDLNWTFLNTIGNSGFSAFGNISGAVVNNPVLDAVNASCNVFLYNKTGGCETWSGVGYVLNTPLDFTTMTNKIFKIKVLAQTQVADVTLLLEENPFPNNNPFIERVASITEVGQWQELTFDFSDINTGTFKNMVIYFDRNTPCDGDIYYFDDITQKPL